MFLSKVLPLKGFLLSSVAEQANGGDAYAQHQLLWQLFPERSKREFLFRYEHGANGPCYYLLSSCEPTSTAADLQIISKPFRPKLKAGDQLAYTLRANPTRMLRSVSPGQRGQRVDVLMHAKVQAEKRSEDDVVRLQHEAAQNWLMEDDRQARLGVKFTVLPEVTEHQQHQVYKSRKTNSQAKPIRFTSVNYRGTLSVTDPGVFLESMRKGIGRAKAMGCGLMMIRPCE